jgi:aminoglycoside/choline kinase family phosphotransferase
LKSSHDFSAAEAFAARAMALLIDPTVDEPGVEELAITPLAGDGSARTIYRVRRAGLQTVLVSNPLPPGRSRPDENDGFLAVREYLQQRRVRVPGFYAADLEAGLMLLEDLGDTRLYDRVREGRAQPADFVALYELALHALVAMQAPGLPAFRLAMVPNPPYTEGFVLDQEARYFHEELVRGYAGFDLAFEAIEEDCRALARGALAGVDWTQLPPVEPLDRAAWESLSYAEATHAGLVFLHRDYQSRNLMIAGGTPAVIDFQGARLGPPEYDLASLLYDPYTALEETLRERLIDCYLEAAAAAGVPRVPGLAAGLTPEWRQRFYSNAANRLMQALGAYAKLGGRFGRPGFIEHIPAALANLSATLSRAGAGARLRDLVAELAERHIASGPDAG